MITLITGTPGAGKTLYVVMHVIRPALDEGRVVYVSGIPGLKLSVVPITVDQLREWYVVRDGSIDGDHHGHLTNIVEGSLIVIDEVQRVWRPTGSSSTVPPDIAALELHRHYGLDFVLVCQHPSLLHRNIRVLVGRHIHLRSTALGRYSYEWSEWQENPQTRSSRSLAVTRRYSLPKDGFSLYESASVHVKQSKRLPWQVPVLLSAFVAVPYLGYRLYASIDAKSAASTVTSSPSKLIASSPSASSVSSSPSASSASSSSVVSSASSTPSLFTTESPTAKINISGVSDQVDWSLVAGCIRSATRCTCYGFTGERLVVPVPLCEQALEFGWSRQSRPSSVRDDRRV